MQVTILSFGALKDVLGASSRDLELPVNATVADAVRKVFGDDAMLNRWINRLMVAVNREQVAMQHRLSENDEVALMPPVSGG